MKEKKALPAWAVAASVAAALLLVVAIFVKGGEAVSGPSRDVLIQQRQAQDHAGANPIVPPAANSRNVGHPQ